MKSTIFAVIALLFLQASSAIAENKLPIHGIFGWFELPPTSVDKPLSELVIKPNEIKKMCSKEVAIFSKNGHHISVKLDNINVEIVASCSKSSFANDEIICKGENGGEPVYYTIENHNNDMYRSCLSGNERSDCVVFNRCPPKSKSGGIDIYKHLLPLVSK